MSFEPNKLFQIKSVKIFFSHREGECKTRTVSEITAGWKIKNQIY